MHPLLLLPAAVFSFVAGASLGQSRRGLSMLAPRKSRVLVTSPLPGIPTRAWCRFVRAMVVAPQGAVGPRGRLGHFGMDARRLADVGVVRDPHKETVAGEHGVWTGTWSDPLTRERFLSSSGAQYAAFSKSMEDLAPHVAGMVGAVVDGSRATLSGLLGVAHLSGAGGVRSWVESPGVRSKFQRTTETFKRTNNIF